MIQLFLCKENANREQNLPSLLDQLCRGAAFFGYKVSNFIVTFQEKGGKKWEYDEFFFQNQENAGESGSIAALRELSQKTKMNTVLQYYSFILKGVLFPNFILYYIYI